MEKDELFSIDEVYKLCYRQYRGINRFLRRVAVEELGIRLCHLFITQGEVKK
jgi:hypothetical protein